jgi:hypothetical protein
VTDARDETSARDRGGRLKRSWRPIRNKTGRRLVGSLVQGANASVPSHTSASLSAGMADRGSGHADTVDPRPTGTASRCNGYDHAIWLGKPAITTILIILLLPTDFSQQRKVGLSWCNRTPRPETRGLVAGSL